MLHFFTPSDRGLKPTPAALIPLDTPEGRHAMVLWHHDIQIPYINSSAGNGRADQGWNWPRNSPWMRLYLQAARKRDYGFAVVAQSPTGTAVTLALAFCIQPFNCVEFSDGRKPFDAFVWYVTAIPSSAAQAYGFPKFKLTSQVIALCEELAHNLLPASKIVLHADVRGEQRLFGFYASDCGMTNLAKSARISAPHSRVNDGRFFRSSDQS